MYLFAFTQQMAVQKATIPKSTYDTHHTAMDISTMYL